MTALRPRGLLLRRGRAIALACALGLLGALPALAQNDAEVESSAGTEEIVVRGRSDSLVGSADSVSQGTVGAEQLERRTLARPGEVLETVPGVIVTQHSGAGKA